MSSTSSCNDLIHLPHEVQIHIGTFLRAYDLAQLQQTCTHFSLKDGRRYVHSIIEVFANHVYPPELTEGYETTPPLFGTNDPVKKAIEKTAKSRQGQTSRNGQRAEACRSSGGSRGAEYESQSESAAVLTFEHLRDMEMLVLVRLLSLPEPPATKAGSSSTMTSCAGRTIMEDMASIDEGYGEDQAHHYYYVSKSWCKAALKWLESQEEERRQREELAQGALRAGGGACKNSKHHHHQKKAKKISRKQQRIRSRRLSDVSPPWPNANQDLLCPHGELMRHSSKAARSKRRIMDKHAWKVLRKLYPDSVPLKCRYGAGAAAAVGGVDAMDHDACLQCWAECESEKRSLEQSKLQLEQERKKPLSNPLIRAFYVRASRGVPQDRIVRSASVDTKPSATSSCGNVPLLPGVYHVIPRTWCQRWRRYMKSGGIDKQTACLPPDATDMLCDVHKLPLLPPHLEQFLRGESPGGTLFPSLAPNAPPPQSDLRNDSSRSLNGSGGGGYVPGEATTSFGGVVSSPRAAASSSSATSQSPRGEATGITTALLAAAAADGISAINVERELESQFNALANMGLASPSATSSRNSSSVLAATERENQTLVEIVTDEEFSALEQEFWPRMEGTCFTLRFDVAAAYSHPESAAQSSICHPCGATATNSVEWFYKPCRECENDDLTNMMRQNPDCIERRMVVRNRVRNNLETNHSSTGENWKWKKPSPS